MDDRLLEESNAAWQAYVAYRNLGPSRSLAKVGRTLGKSTALMERWSAAHRWVARAAAFDAEADQAVRQAIIGRQVAIADKATQTLLSALSLLDPATLAASPATVARWLEAVSRTANLATGQATDITETHDEAADAYRSLMDAFAASAHEVTRQAVSDAPYVPPPGYLWDKHD